MEKRAADAQEAPMAAVLVRLRPSQRRAVEELARKEERTMSNLVRLFINQGLRRHGIEV